MTYKMLINWTNLSIRVFKKSTWAWVENDLFVHNLYPRKHWMICFWKKLESSVEMTSEKYFANNDLKIETPKNDVFRNSEPKICSLDRACSVWLTHHKVFLWTAYRDFSKNYLKTSTAEISHFWSLQELDFNNNRILILLR